MFRSTRHRWGTRAAAAATLVVAAGIMAAFPAEAPLPEGWRTPIIAFELARSPADIAWLQGPDAAGLRDAMRAGHRVDTVFPFAYGLLLAASCRAASGRWAALAVGLALAAVGLDLGENATLAGITEALEAGGDGAAGLRWLVPLTWSKWGAIGGALLSLCLAQWREEPRVALVLAPLALSVPVAGFTGAPAAGETMALAVSLAFGLLAARSIWLGVRPLSTAPPP
jgi:hypothetical protein